MTSKDASSVGFHDIKSQQNNSQYQQVQLIVTQSRNRLHQYNNQFVCNIYTAFNRIRFKQITVHKQQQLHKYQIRWWDEWIGTLAVNNFACIYHRFAPEPWSAPRLLIRTPVSRKDLIFGVLHSILLTNALIHLNKRGKKTTVQSSNGQRSIHRRSDIALQTLHPNNSGWTPLIRPRDPHIAVRTEETRARS
jgi:hypothetical protein